MTGVTWLDLGLSAAASLAAPLEICLERARLGGWVVLQEDPDLEWQFFLPMEPGWQDRLSALELELTSLGGRLTRLGEVQDEDWAENWKRFYHPLKVGRGLVVCPSWENYPAQPGEHIITLDPGSAFGTGYHWSTRLCLELLEDLEPVQDVLDLGTGSGILAIGAWRLGHRNLRALDNDPVAIRVARENFEINGVSAQTELAEGPCGGPYALILANLVALLHVELASQLADCLGAGGRLIAGGIIRERRDDVVSAFALHGLALEKERAEEDWVALRLVRS